MQILFECGLSGWKEPVVPFKQEYLHDADR